MSIIDSEEYNMLASGERFECHVLTAFSDSSFKDVLQTIDGDERAFHEAV